jgi:putative (di)nucleoside polyphosphate hydrolase
VASTALTAWLVFAAARLAAGRAAGRLAAAAWLVAPVTLMAAQDFMSEVVLMPALAALPYRPNVGAALFNAHGQVLVARRADLPNAEGASGGWQLPQGGIDAAEDPRAAVLRELAEEIGTDRAEIIGEHPEWLTYDLPPHLLGRSRGGRYRGQRQRWFALRFLGTDADIRLDVKFPNMVDFNSIPGLVSRPFIIQFSIQSQSDKAGSDRWSGRSISKHKVHNESFRTFLKQGLKFRFILGRK